MVVRHVARRRLLRRSDGAYDFLESYLRAIFGFVGISDMTFFNAQPMDVSPELRRDAYASVIGEVRAWAAQTGRGAASAVPQVALPDGAKPPQVLIE